MKINKKQAGLIAGLVCLFMVILLLFSMCGRQEDDFQAAPKDPSVTADAPAEETAAPAEETEAKDSTEETEETDPTEETTGTTTGGNSTPGGAGGYNPGGSTGGNTGNNTNKDLPAPGKEESPYMEVVSTYPDSVSTVNVSAQGAVHYSLMLNDASVETYGASLLVIEDANAYVVYNKVKYEAKNGVVSVPLIAPEEKDTPVSIQIGNNSKTAAPFQLILDAPLGTEVNPERLSWKADSTYELKTSLEAEDKDGYFFGFVAKRDGKLTVKLDSVTEGASCDVIIKAGERTVSVPVAAENPAAELEFSKGTEVTVQIVAKTDAEGKYPALEASVSGTAVYYGDKNSPLKVTADFVTEQMESGDEVWYMIENMGGRTVNVEDPAYVIYQDVTYKAPEKEPSESEDAEESEEIPVVSVKFGNTDNSAVFAIGNGGEEAEKISVTFGYPAGNINNKAPLVVANVDEETVGLNTAVIGEGDQDVYWYSWINEADSGNLTLTLPQEGNWKYAITHTSGDKKTEYPMQFSDAQDVQRTVNLLLSYNDVVDIFVSTYDPEAEEGTPAPVGSVELHASFLAHVLTSPSGDSLVTVEGNGLQYVKQGLKKVEDGIMTMTAVEIDEEGNAKLDADGNPIALTDKIFTVDYEGVVYESVDGRIVVEGINMDSNNPDIFSVLNRNGETTSYHIRFTYPLGNQANPIPLELGKHTVELYGDAGSGTFYSWTTTEPGIFIFEIDTSSNSIWNYQISSTMGSHVLSSEQNGTSTNVDPDAEMEIELSHITDSEDGTVTVTVNLGNPSSDAANKSTVNFTIGFCNTKITSDTTVTVEAGETHRLMHMLTDKSADSMTVTAGDSFTVVYNGQSYNAENGTVKILDFTAENTYFQIINNSDTEQDFFILFNYPLRSEKNPEVVETGGRATIDMNTSPLDEDQYFAWTAPEDGVFKFELVGDSNLKRKKWEYTITYGKESISEKNGTKPKLEQTFAVKAGDTVSIRIKVMETISYTFYAQVNFEKATPVEFTGNYEPQPFQLAAGEEERLVYADLTKTPDLYLAPEQGIYYHYETGAAMYVDLSSDTFMNLKKLMETQPLYWDTVAEDGSVIRETYDALLQEYIANAHVVPVSETEEKTLYPMTEDLVYILIRIGNQLGWYNSQNSAYPFAEVANAETEYLWMFPCCWAETPAVNTQSQQTTAEGTNAAIAATVNESSDVTPAEESADAAK